jgi:hypothetical protein
MSVLLAKTIVNFRSLETEFLAQSLLREEEEEEEKSDFDPLI